MGGLITGNLYLDWAILALSLFNMVLLFWLGGAVILNAERRTWGLALAGGGLLLAGTIFLAHTAIVGRGLEYVGRWMNFWWGLGWVPAQAAPLIWYFVILWYTGFGSDRQSRVRRHHRFYLPVVMALALTQMALPLFDPHPLPSYAQMVNLRWDQPLSIGTLPILVLLYPLYALLCFGLSLDALRRPGASRRIMGDLARHRARPWLVATALALLAASLLGSGTLLWFLGDARQGGRYLTDPDVLTTLAWFDVIVSGVIAAAVLLLGQAITRYEVFTGKTLPRRGLTRHWRSAVALAVGYGVVIGWSLALQLHPIYGLLLATVLMVGFYMLFSWRSYAERDRFMQQLRPFVTSQSMYRDLLAASPTTPTVSPASPVSAASKAPAILQPNIDALTPFRALCRDVLGARVGYLVALGPLSPLVGQPLAYAYTNSDTQGYPSGESDLSISDLHTLSTISALSALFTETESICIPVDPARYAGASWAVPLLSERGLIGAVLLGDKLDGGLFAHEEIEIAQAVGERLIDTQASVAMAQRLMLLQRRQLAESQVLDRRARRVLHDEVLPLLHTALLTFSAPSTITNANANANANANVNVNGRTPPGATPSDEEGNRDNERKSDALSLLSDAHRQITGLLRDIPAGVSLDVARLGLVGALQRVASEELEGAFDSVEWQVEPDIEVKVSGLPPFAVEVIYFATREAMRNAARHGRGSDTAQTLELRIEVTWRDGLVVIVEDTGVGLDGNDWPRSDGQGLALHSTLMAVVGGSLVVERIQSKITRVTLALHHHDFPGRQ